MKGTIWVVEDDPSISEVCEIILKEEAYAVELFASEEACKKALKKKLPDLILLDLLLSGGDGRNISRHVKNNAQTQHIPVVILSADTLIEEKAKEANADGFLKKPFDIAELVDVVKELMHTSISADAKAT